MGVGDYFGEVALVNACKRTATVRAKGPVRCLAMVRGASDRRRGLLTFPWQDRVAFGRIAEPCLEKLSERFKIYL
jgi:hypothetical protein